MRFSVTYLLLCFNVPEVQQGHTLQTNRSYEWTPEDRVLKGALQGTSIQLETTGYWEMGLHALEVQVWRRRGVLGLDKEEAFVSRIDLVKTINKRRWKRAGPVVSFAGCGRTTLFHSSTSTQIDARLCNLFMELYIALPLVTFYFYFISSSRSLQWKQELFPRRKLPFDTYSYKWKSGWGEIAIVHGRHWDQKRCDYSLKVYISIESTRLETWQGNPSGHCFITQWSQ